MKFMRALLDTCGKADDIVVVIDVLRAFSTAAYAFGSGAHRITLVASVEEALLMKKRDPSVLLMGEVDGLKIDGFDFGNSPTELANQDLVGRQLVQRTTAGTQGVVRSTNAGIILASSFCCAGATARFLHPFHDHTVTFVITGITSDGRGSEDEACADYLESLLKGENPDNETYLRRVRESKNAQKFISPGGSAFPLSDLELCTSANRFNFAMFVERRNGQCVMKPVLS
jgi:2-phosphosulfolactate phosphatase